MLNKKLRKFIVNQQYFIDLTRLLKVATIYNSNFKENLKEFTQ